MDSIDYKRNLPGTYVLALEIYEKILIKAKHLQWNLNSGYYFYFGSAKGKTSTSLKHRIQRHLNSKKKVFWHIDHLTTHSSIYLHRVYLNLSEQSSECQNLGFFSNDVEIEIITRFGSSDCKENCGGHLGLLLDNTLDLRWLDNYFKNQNWELVQNEN